MMGIHDLQGAMSIRITRQYRAMLVALLLTFEMPRDDVHDECAGKTMTHTQGWTALNHSSKSIKPMLAPCMHSTPH